MSQLSCLTINLTLEAVSLYGTQLSGLSNANNTKNCSFSSQMERLFTFSDFAENLTNPIYQSEIIQEKLNMVFLPICYAYSILRVCMVISVMCYVNQKMHEIFNSHRRFPSEKQVELNWYKYTIYASMIIELICAIRDFVLFKGTLLFTNLMDSGPQTCYVNIYDFGNIDCGTNNQDSWRPFNYNREDCNCLYYKPQQYLSGDQYNPYMTFNIIFWVITESLTQGLVGFTILILSRLNKEEKSGWPFIKPTLIRVVISTLFVIILYIFLIYYLNLRIYYRFYNFQVIVFFFCQKCVIFLIIFDRLYSKIWLELKLRLPILHSSGIDWTKNLETLKRMIMRQKQPPQQIQEIYKQKYRNVYEQTLTNYYDDALRPYVDKYEREYNSKMKTQWQDYLNYLLLMNLIGIIGYTFLGGYGLYQDKTNPASLFWIGFILALVELIVFEVSNIVFQLHCFLIELYKQCEEEFSTLESNQQDSGLQGFT